MIPMKTLAIGAKVYEIVDETARFFVTPEMYGAKADGVTDDANAFRSLPAGTIVLKAGATYKVNASFTYITNKDLHIIGNGATLDITFSGQNAPRFFYNNNVFAENLSIVARTEAGTSRARVFDNVECILRNVYASIEAVPADEKLSFVESQYVDISWCTIECNSNCTTDGSTVWARGSDSELYISKSFISGVHRDEVICNYGTGSTHTHISDSRIVTSSKFSFRAVTQVDGNASTVIFENNVVDFTGGDKERMGFDVGGYSSVKMILRDCVLSGNITYLISSGTFADGYYCDVSVSNIDCENLVYNRFANASLSLDLSVCDTKIDYLMSNPTTFKMRRLALRDCYVANTVLVGCTTSATPIMDVSINGCVIDNVVNDNTIEKTVENPHVMIHALIAGSEVNLFK